MPWIGGCSALRVQKRLLAGLTYVAWTGVGRSYDTPACWICLLIASIGAMVGRTSKVESLSVVCTIICVEYAYCSWNRFHRRKGVGTVNSTPATYRYRNKCYQRPVEKCSELPSGRNTLTNIITHPHSLCFEFVHPVLIFIVIETLKPVRVKGIFGDEWAIS